MPESACSLTHFPRRHQLASNSCQKSLSNVNRCIRFFCSVCDAFDLRCPGNPHYHRAHSYSTDFQRHSKQLILSCIEVVDLFLLATVFYITALGLYELFIDERIKVPDWLEIHTIDDLKTKLTSVIVVVLSVLFLSEVVRWNGGTNILPLGSGIALVIAALTYFLSSQVKKPKSD